ncbi:hypothetical protein LUZ62_077752 [Rhynchospora pubera]|uniref:Cytochrome P450 n=1 Tax=Rhynchospora pubera TaxID=906938 RepID=A0AAV8DFL7_9POAL|nr:hypothetical protein LUZ62_077752 [Rhynchospora pubera]
MDASSPLSVLLLLSLVTISSLLLFIQKRKKNPQITYPLGFKPYPLVGYLPQYLANRHRTADWFSEMLANAPNNTIVFHRLGGVRKVITANPANVEHILRTHFDNYPKGEMFLTTLHDFLGTGIFNADGKTWQMQRKKASYEFNTKSLRSFIERCVHQEIETRLLPLLQQASATGQVIDLQDVFERFAFDNVCKVSFDLDPGCLDPESEEEAAHDNKTSSFTNTFSKAFRNASSLSAQRFRYAIPRFWKIKKLFDIGSERRLRESISIVHEFADQIIHSRKKEKQTKQDLLSRFVASSDHYSERFLRDIVISFLLAGRETTSSALSWFFWILSSRPEVEAKILDEIRSIRAKNRGSGMKGYDFEDLKEMNYLHAAISESMRLYTPVPVFTSQAMEDDILPDGTHVKKGWLVSYNSYAMGRMEANWGKDCLEYRPERWIDADGTFRQENSFKFTAFHAGPRMCLGKEMAYIQMKSIVASVLEHFELEVEGKERCPEKIVATTLRMKDGLSVRVRERNY